MSFKEHVCLVRDIALTKTGRDTAVSLLQETSIYECIAFILEISNPKI